MSNELIFLLTTFLDLAFVLVFFRLGRRGLLASVIVNVILVATFGGKLITVFGLVTNAANVFYAAIFLAVNMMVERFDRQEGLKAIWAGFGSLVIFILMGQAVVLMQGVGETATVSTAIEVLFKTAPRIAFASMFAYLISQHLNLWLFDYLKQLDILRLGLRNLASTIPAQLIDSLLFFSLAFYGKVSPEILIQSIAVGFLLKMIIAFFSVPFLLFSKNMQISGSAPASIRLVGEKYQPRDEHEIDWQKIKISKMIAVFVSAVGILVMGGWLFNIPILTYVVNGLETMKFSTAVSFFCTGFLLYFLTENHLGRHKYADLVIPAMVMIVVFFMATLLATSILKVQIGVEELFIKETAEVENISVASGMPSLVTMVNFMLISAASLVALGKFFKMSGRYKILGSVLFITGFSGLLGYLFQQPQFYFDLPRLSNGLSIHAALLFAFTGIGFIALGLSKRKI